MDRNGSSPCFQCSPGLYADEGLAGPCQACPQGRYTHRNGTTSISECIVCNILAGEQCLSAAMNNPRPAAGYYMKSGNLSSLTTCTPAVACIGNMYGEPNCQIGYTNERCASCQQSYYRAEGQCVACGQPVPIWILLSIVCTVFIIALMIGDELLSDVHNKSQLMAPTFIVLKFAQTLSTLIPLSRTWPLPIRNLLTFVSFTNLNLELVRPECTMDYSSLDWHENSAEAKIVVALWLPLLLLMTVAIYYGVKVIHHFVMRLIRKQMAKRKPKALKESEREFDSIQPTDNDQPAAGSSQWVGLSDEKVAFRGPPDWHALNERCKQLGTGFFFTFTPYFLGVMLTAFDCSENKGRLFLDVQPDLQCTLDNSDYISLLTKSTVGIGIWTAAFMVVKVRFIRPSGRYRYPFWQEKMKEKFHWWELLILGRQLAIMSFAMFTSEHPAQASYWGSTVLVGALALHTFAHPYKDPAIDRCEFISLLSILLLYQGGMVWTFDSESQADGEDGLLSTSLMVISVSLIMTTFAAALYLQVKQFMQRYTKAPTFTDQDLLKLKPSELKEICHELEIDMGGKHFSPTAHIEPCPFWIPLMVWLKKMTTPHADPYDILLDTDDPKGLMMRLILSKQAADQLSAEEAAQRLGLVRRLARRMFVNGGTNGNGFTFDEFVVVARAGSEEELSIADLQRVFNEMDVDGSGRISALEFASYAAKAGIKNSSKGEGAPETDLDEDLDDDIDSFDNPLTLGGGGGGRGVTFQSETPTRPSAAEEETTANPLAGHFAADTDSSSATGGGDFSAFDNLQTSFTFEVEEDTVEPLAHESKAGKKKHTRSGKTKTLRKRSKPPEIAAVEEDEEVGDDNDIEADSKSSPKKIPAKRSGGFSLGDR
eukprot:SAG25_NODE_22_length_22323_cov_52.926874_20_plen_880_part_00